MVSKYKVNLDSTLLELNSLSSLSQLLLLMMLAFSKKF